MPARRLVAPAAAGGASSLLRLSLGSAPIAGIRQATLPRASVLSPRREPHQQLSLFGPAGRAALR